MAKGDDPTVMMVQTQPGGRRTAVVSEGGSMFYELWGDLCGNDDAASFYRAVAAYMGTMSACGKRVLYTDVKD